MICKIVRLFEGDHGRQFTPGEIVDSTAWPKEAQLRRQRYIEPAPEGSAVTAKNATAEGSDHERS